MIGRQLQRMDEYTDDAVSLLDEEIHRGAQMLKAAIDYDLLRYQGLPHKTIIYEMKKREGVYNAEILEVLAGLSFKKEEGKVMTLMVRDIQTGMVVEEDVFANNGVMVIPRGQVVTWPILQGLDNFSKQVGIQEPVCVRMGGWEKGD